MDSTPFARQTVWITGASSGIGSALAGAFSRCGARLILSARREEELNQVRLHCANPEAHLVLLFDLTTYDPEATAQRALDAFGAIDILINNGGISQRSLVAEAGIAVDRRIMEVNFFGAVALTKAVLPSMLARRSGHIVAISSLAGKISTPRRSAYAASKHALHGFFDALRAEVYGDGIRVTLICPGYVRTNLSLHALTGTGTAHGKLDRTQARGIPPEQLADRILLALEQGKDEALIGGREVLAVYVKRFIPSLFNRLIRRAKIT